jgi:hypothetical protein
VLRCPYATQGALDTSGKAEHECTSETTTLEQQYRHKLYIRHDYGFVTRLAGTSRADTPLDATGLGWRARV